MARSEFQKQLEGYGLTTANILYRMPDNLDLLQTFVWQQYDMAPTFPELARFLNFWQRELDGPLHSVTICHKGLISPAECRMVGHELRLH